MSTLDLGKLKFLWRGTWSTGSSYAQNDVVAYNSAIWICTQSHGTGLSTEYSPGKRDRLNVLGKTVDPQEIIPINVTVGTYGAGNVFYLDGRPTPALTLYPNVRYRFLQKDASNTNHRFALSSSVDGIFAVNGVEYTAGVFQYGTPGVDGYMDVVLDSTMPATLYYFSANDLNFGNGAAGRLIRTPSWRGYQYWDQVTSGMTFKGAWVTTTQYYYNDIIEYEGATYLALADNLNKPPVTPDLQRNNGNLITNSTASQYSQYWQLLTPGDRKTEHNSVAFFANKGPLDWPYAPGNNGNPNQLQSIKWVSRSGRIYQNGTGASNNHGTHNAVYANNPAPTELCFNHTDWWLSRDNGGTGKMTTPDGQPPRCIQVESGWDYNYYVFNNGEVWSSGTGANGGNGVGDTTDVPVPRRVVGLNDVRIVKISAAFGGLSSIRHVLALDDQGYVWTWGRNNLGQLGLGDTTDRSSPTRIPRTYFGNERVTDILAMGTDNGWSYARVASDNIYAWGNNGSSQLGNGDTTNRYRPVKMTNWDPVANNGIRKWQGFGFNGAASFMICDGNGFLWHCGNDYGHSTFASAATRTQLTRSTTTPNGNVANFWNVWSGDTVAQCATYIRHTNGTTYSCGQASTYSNVQGTTGVTTQILSPTLLSTTLGIAIGLINIKEVYLHISYTADQRRTIHFLRDDGRVFAQGNNGANELGNPYLTTNANNNVDESGVTNYPAAVFNAPSHKVVSILPGGSGSSDLAWSHGIFYLLANGQVLANGQTRNTNSIAGTEATTRGDARRTNSGNFISYNPSMAEGSSISMPQSVTYGR